MNIQIGQIWKNGVTAVKVQDDSMRTKQFELVVFDVLQDSDLKFRDVFRMDESEASQYINTQNCVLTDHVLSLV